MNPVLNGGGGVRQSMNLLTFAMKIGLVRESVRVDLTAYDGRLTTEMLRDIAFAFLYRNVRMFRVAVVRISTVGVVKSIIIGSDQRSAYKLVKG